MHNSEVFGHQTVSGTSMDEEQYIQVHRQKRNKILIYEKEPLDLSEARKRLGGIAHYVDGITSDGLPDGLARRKSPSMGSFDRINLEDACTEAVVRTMMNGALASKWLPEEVYEFLNPSELGLPTTPYTEKLIVVRKILDRFYSHFYGGYHKTRYAGDINDPTTSFRRTPLFERTPLFWFENHSYENRFEVLFDTQREANVLLIKDATSYFMDALKARHQEENIFANGPVDSVVPIGNGWYIPVLGLTSIKQFTSEKGGLVIDTTLNSQGISYKDIEIDPKKDRYEQYTIRPSGSEYFTINR